MTRRADSVAYVGDDVIDLPVMTKVGFAIAVANAHDTVKQYANLITEKSGGHGAVRLQVQKGFYS
jgi:3-deoxy-D-manno-octulosonate 8-phosphate phosphatase (KDO 8-P phosphatase)